MDQFLTWLYRLLVMPTEVLITATETIYAFDFDNNLLIQYLGYMKWALGTPLYTLFIGVAIITLGVSVWRLGVKSIGYLWDMLPFV